MVATASPPTTVAALSHADRFWRLCEALYIAEHHTHDDNKPRLAGFRASLRNSFQEAVAFDLDTCVRLARTSRTSLTTHPMPRDPYYDGYVAGCDKAIHILQGGL